MEGNTNAESLQKQIENSKVLEQLRMAFHTKIDWDVIFSAAIESGFELGKATSCLNELTSSPTMPELKDVNENVDRIIGTLKRGIKVLIMLRGLPGSGKSYLANKIVRESIGSCTLRDHILSADDYFYNNGDYKYDYRYITEAHRWNQTRAHRLMHDGVSPIIIDNTHTQMWEMKPYCIWGVQYGYMLEILEPGTPWAFNERELFKRNKHDVPKNKIRDMMDRYERNLTVEKVFHEFELCYGEGKVPPQPRKYPTITVLKDEIFLSDDDVCIVDKENDCGVTKEQAWQSIDLATKTYASVETNFNYKDIDDPSLKVIIARKDFNNVAILPPMYKKGGLLDKGTMTDDDESGACDLSLDHIVSLFETKYPLEYILEIYEKCNKDVEWAIEILLDIDIMDNYKPEPKPKAMEIDESVQYVDCECIDVDDSSSDEDKLCLQIERQNLKQMIESNFEINDEHYSDRLWNLKHKGRKKRKSVLPKPSTSREENKDSDDSDVIIIDSDPDIEESNEFIEFNLGDEFVAQLEEKFGNPTLKYPRGFQPIIEMPKSLGIQLHAMYMESIFKQMDAQNLIIKNMIKEDEDLARKLQQEEGRVTPTFKDIMSEQKVLSKQQSVNEEWKKQTPDDIAYKMSKQKLLESFPDVPSKDLIEILHAHGNSYTQTFEVLRQSGAMHVDNLNVNEPPISNEIISEMREACQSDDSEEQAEARKTAEELREEAAEFHRRRNELLQKVQYYQTRRMTEVAMYYSNLASQQTQKLERANNDAANVILSEHFNRLGAFDTLDLHFLRVSEALTALDVFLDRNIMLLQKSKTQKYEFLMILTGRGRNSRGGIPRIKPAVQDRLDARGLKYQLVNPGLLRTKILSTSLMTDNLNRNV